MTRIFLAEGDIEIERCFPVMVELRTALAQDKFVSQVKRQQRLNEFKLAYLEVESEVKAVAGFRISENLAFGKFLYVDDLVTKSSEQSKGYGDKLFDWLLEYAKAESCTQLQLDSGVQRFEAHRFYMRKRMNISSYHFSRPIS